MDGRCQWNIDGLVVQGIGLVQFEPEVDVNSCYKICAFGCTKGGVHQHLSKHFTTIVNFSNQSNHQSPSTKITARCSRFPDALLATSATTFLERRNIDQLGGVEVYFKYIPSTVHFLIVSKYDTPTNRPSH